MPICGMYATAAADGSVSYGGKGRFVFARDAAIRSRPSRHGRAIDYLHEASLLETSVRMDAACRWKVANRRRFPSVPVLPRILLGFAPFEVPLFEDSPALRRLAAKRIGVHIDDLGTNGEVLLDRLLKDVWHDQLILPGDPRNSTGLVLVNAELCTNARRSLQIFEDFCDLCGDKTWNPAKAMTLPTVDNPASSVLSQHGLEGNRDFDQVTSMQLELLESDMRQALGEGFASLDPHLIFDALVNSRQSVIDYPKALAQLRDKLPLSVAECCSDADLVQAVVQVDRSLQVSGRCRLQVLRGVSTSIESEDLGRRSRITLRGAPAGNPRRRLPIDLNV